MIIFQSPLHLLYFTSQDPKLEKFLQAFLVIITDKMMIFVLKCLIAYIEVRRTRNQVMFTLIDLIHGKIVSLGCCK